MLLFLLSLKSEVIRKEIGIYPGIDYSFFYAAILQNAVDSSLSDAMKYSLLPATGITFPNTDEQAVIDR